MYSNSKRNRFSKGRRVRERCTQGLWAKGSRTAWGDPTHTSVRSVSIYQSQCLCAALVAALAEIRSVESGHRRFSSAPPTAGSDDNDALLHLWGFREHSKLDLSVLLKAVMACFDCKDVGSSSHRFFDRLCFSLKRAPPRSGAASSYFTRADSGDWAQGHERAKSTYPDKPTRLWRAGAQPIGVASSCSKTKLVTRHRFLRRVFS